MPDLSSENSLDAGRFKNFPAVTVRVGFQLLSSCVTLSSSRNAVSLVCSKGPNKKDVDKYFTGITITSITVTEMTAIASSTLALQAAPADRAAAREEARRQMERMSEAMIEEKGLLNHAQAALLLDVSTKRVGELVRLGKLTDFIFLGRKYVSMREVWDRNKQELKAGRPPRPMGQRVAAQLKAAVKTDSAQASLGGYAGSYFTKQREEANERRRAEFKKKWRAILEVRRNERKD